jgi:hypothetical protein
MRWTGSRPEASNLATCCTKSLNSFTVDNDEPVNLLVFYEAERGKLATLSVP